MGRLSKEEQARFAGADWMLKIAETQGVDAARKELEYRNVRGLPLAVKKSDFEKCWTDEKKNLTNCLILLAISTLHDEYGFGLERMNRFISRFNTKGACLLEGYVDWHDLQQTIKEESGLMIPLPEY